MATASLRSAGLPFATLFLLTAGCSSGPSADEVAQRNKLANDLVTCQNDRSNLKEQLAQAQAELAKLKAATDPTVKVGEALDLAANPSKSGKEGNLPPAAVIKVFKQNQGGLKACYDKGLKRNPNLQYVAALNAHFAVKNSGNAVNVGFSPHADGEMEHCMASTIAKWRFPTFSGDPVQFDYPVNLVAK
jgi:hypothetical protein